MKLRAFDVTMGILTLVQLNAVIMFYATRSHWTWLAVAGAGILMVMWLCLRTKDNDTAMKTITTQHEWGWESRIEDHSSGGSNWTYSWHYTVVGLGKTEEEAKENLRKSLSALACELP